MSAIDLPAIQDAMSRQTPDRAAKVLAAVETLETLQAFTGVQTPFEGYTRLAASLTTVLSDASIVLTPDEAMRLMYCATITANLFAASAFGDAGEALALVRAADLPQSLDRQIALFSPDVRTRLDIDEIIDLPPPAGLMSALNIVATRPILTAQGEARRDAVLAAAERLKDLDLPPALSALAILSNAWMNCSYSSQPGKHALKPALNQVLRALLARLRFAAPPAPVPRPVRARPVMVVVAEVMHENHVQFRYFGQYLRQLRTRFELVLVTPQTQLSPAVPALFDRVFTFDSMAGDCLSKIVGFILATTPDLVFWPSVGMARWGPLIANLRLAPIQMTALGHSASTFIPAMDYYLTEEGYVGDPDLFSETLLLMPDEALRFEPQPGRRQVTPRARGGDGPVIVAVPSNALKLNPTFLGILGEIRRRAARPVRFHLFPNGSAMEAAALKAVTDEALGDPLIHPRLSREAYETALNACDLVLSPFPFGGLHSTVDALRLGLPVLAWEGLEPHSRTDSLILRRAGMPERLIVHTTEDYIAEALTLIDDGALRLELGALALARDIDAIFFAQQDEPLRTEVADSVWAAYRHHETIQASGRKAWTLDALGELA